MAVNQEITTVSAARPLLRAALPSRDISYRSSHLPSRMSATIAGVLCVGGTLCPVWLRRRKPPRRDASPRALSQPACRAGVPIPNYEEQSST
jgi:hypothetical protein